MEAIQNIFELNIKEIVLGIFILIVGSKEIIEFFDWVRGRFGIETKTTLRQKEENEILHIHDEQLDQINKTLNSLSNALKVVLGNEINQKYKDYFRKQYIPFDEIDEFNNLHSAYKMIGGNHNGDEKYEKCKMLPVKDDEEIKHFEQILQEQSIDDTHV